MKATSTVLALALFLNSAVAAAQEVPSPFRPEPVPPGEDVRVPLRKGSPAPFDGILFDTATAARVYNYVFAYERELERVTWEHAARERALRELHEKEKGAERKALEDRLRNTVREARAHEQEEKERLLKAYVRIRELEKEAAQPPPFYRNPWFLGVSGALLGFGAALFFIKK
jgi:hypothetical protein